MQYLRDAGLVAPDEIPTDDDFVPLDFTSLNPRQVGAVHSRYAVRHAHAIYVTAQTASQLVLARRDAKLIAAKYRSRHADEHETKYQLDAAMEEDKNYSKVAIRITELEARLSVLEAVCGGYEDLRNAASREMFRRSSEKAPHD